MSDPSLVRFRVAVQGALAHLESRRQEINDLNVFPVADGDTGDNMALTLRAVLAELDRLEAEAGDRTVDEIGRDEIVQTVARAALLGARGNSGVILSQLIRGAAEELVSRPGELVDPVLLGAAFANAAQRAYASVRAPAEGTMLTVMRDMATSIAHDLAHLPEDQRRLATADPEAQNVMIAAALERAIVAGEASVKRGPERARRIALHNQDVRTVGEHRQQSRRDRPNVAVRVLLAGAMQLFDSEAGQTEIAGVKVGMLPGEDQLGQNATLGECVGERRELDCFRPGADHEPDIYAIQSSP